MDDLTTMKTTLQDCDVSIKKSGDINYPGIVIEFMPKGYYDLPEEERGEPTSVVVEWQKGDEYPRVLIWADVDSEDYTFSIPLKNYDGKRKGKRK